MVKDQKREKKKSRKKKLGFIHAQEPPFDSQVSNLVNIYMNVNVYKIYVFSLKMIPFLPLLGYF